MNKTRILSVDGGGIKGIVPAVVLNHLEKYLKQLSSNPNARILDYFDLFSGASTGAIIIALVYFRPGFSEGGYQFQVVFIDRIQEGRCAVRLFGVDVSAFTYHVQCMAAIARSNDISQIAMGKQTTAV